MSNEGKQNEQRAQRSESNSGVIVVELGREDRNINPLLDCANDSYRGIYRRSNRSIAERMSFENDGVPDLPGFIVEVDVRNERISLYDPLTRPQYKTVRKQLERHLENPPQSEHHIPRRRFTPLEDRVTNHCANELLVTWLMELHRMVEAGDAQLRSGEFPKVVIDRVKADRKRDAEMQWGAKDPLPQLV